MIIHTKAVNVKTQMLRFLGDFWCHDGYENDQVKLKIFLPERKKIGRKDWI